MNHFKVILLNIAEKSSSVWKEVKMVYWSHQQEQAKLCLFSVHHWDGWKRLRQQLRWPNFKVTPTMTTMKYFLLFKSGKPSSSIPLCYDVMISQMELQFVFLWILPNPPQNNSCVEISQRHPLQRQDRLQPLWDTWRGDCTLIVWQ